MIEVNEYARTKDGVIDKVDALYEMIENTVHLENQKWFRPNPSRFPHKLCGWMKDGVAGGK